MTKSLKAHHISTQNNTDIKAALSSISDMNDAQPCLFILRCFTPLSALYCFSCTYLSAASSFFGKLSASWSSLCCRCSCGAPSNRPSVRRNHPNQPRPTQTLRRWRIPLSLPLPNSLATAPAPQHCCSATHAPAQCECVVLHDNSGPHHGPGLLTNTIKNIFVN